jgi:C4-dicarboxylate-specific signal transduction histidine kinase
MIDNIIAAIIGLFAGNVAMFLFFPQMRKTKVLENEAKQSEEWRKLYEETHEELKQRTQAYETKIEQLYEEVTQHRDTKAQLRQTNTELEVENTKLCLLKCELPKCPNRKPPTGY